MDVCGGTVVFFNSSVSLPSPTPTTECSFLSQPGRHGGPSITIRDDPGLHLINKQHQRGKAKATSSSISRRSGTWKVSNLHIVKLIGIKLKHMVYLLQTASNTDGYWCAVIWVSGLTKPEVQLVIS